MFDEDEEGVDDYLEEKEEEFVDEETKFKN